MTNLIMTVACFGACAYLVDRKPGLAGWCGVAGLVYGVLLFGSIG